MNESQNALCKLEFSSFLVLSQTLYCLFSFNSVSFLNLMSFFLCPVHILSCIGCFAESLHFDLGISFFQDFTQNKCTLKNRCKTFYAKNMGVHSGDVFYEIWTACEQSKGTRNSHGSLSHDLSGNTAVFWPALWPLFSSLLGTLPLRDQFSFFPLLLGLHGFSFPPVFSAVVPEEEPKTRPIRPLSNLLIKLLSWFLFGDFVLTAMVFAQFLVSAIRRSCLNLSSWSWRRLSSSICRFRNCIWILFQSFLENTHIWNTSDPVFSEREVEQEKEIIRRC